MRGGTAESRVVPLRKKSDIREGRGQNVGVLHLVEPANQNHRKEKGEREGTSRELQDRGRRGGRWKRLD